MATSVLLEKNVLFQRTCTLSQQMSLLQALQMSRSRAHQPLESLYFGVAVDSYSESEAGDDLDALKCLAAFFAGVVKTVKKVSG